MIPEIARVWFVLAGVFLLLGAGAWLVAGSSIAGGGLAVVAASSAGLAAVCLVLGVVIAVMAHLRER